MKKTAFALTFILVTAFLISVSVNSLPVVKVVKANPYGDSDRTVWAIESPLNHTVYNTNVLNFSFKCTTNDLWDEFDDGLDLTYCLDGSDYWKEWNDGSIVHVMPPDEERIFIKADLISNPEASRKTFQYSTLLPSLSDGQHRLTMYFEFKSWGPDSPQFVSTQYEGIIFYIDTLAPTITNLSVNGTDSGDRLLSYSVDEEATWVGYSLDNEANVTVNGNTLLKDLPAGAHNVTVYAEDAQGHMGVSETLSFTIEEPEPKLSPVPLVLATTGAVAAVGVGLLVYFKKRKH